MRDIEVKFDKAKLNRVRELLRGILRAMPKVMSRAVNRTATSARTEIVRRIADKIALKKSTIRKKISLKKATYRTWMAKLGISEKRLSLINFKARQTKKGVSYQIENVRKVIKSAFIRRVGVKKRAGVIKTAHELSAFTKSGHKMVFKRAGKERYPLIVPRGPSIGRVFERASLLASKITATSYRKLEKNIDDQIQLVLAKRRAAV